MERNPLNKPFKKGLYRMIKVITTGLALLLLLSACESQHDLDAIPTGLSGGTTSNPTPEVSKQIFDYKKFYYDRSASCGGRAMGFRYLDVNDVLLGKSKNGNDVLAAMKVLIYPNGLYEAEYEEKDVLSYMLTGYSYKKTRVRNFSNSWIVRDGKMILAGIAVIEGHDVAGKMTGAVQYLKNIVSHGLKDKVARANMVWGTSEIRSHREICPEKEDLALEFGQFLSRKNRSEISLRSLQMSEDQQFFSGDMVVTGMELFVDPDGSYNLVAKVQLPEDDYRTDQEFLVENGSWKTQDRRLVLYFGSAGISSESTSVDLTFSRDLWIYMGDKVRNLKMIGRTLTLKYQPSSIGMDELTHTLK